MPKLFLISILGYFLIGCEVHVNVPDSRLESLGSTFLDDLYHQRRKQCIEKMDDLFKAAASKWNLDSLFNILSENLQTEFQGEISSTLVSSKKTTHENLPATLLKYKVESAKKTSYYNFYINDKTEKILLISENQDVIK